MAQPHNYFLSCQRLNFFHSDSEEDSDEGSAGEGSDGGSDEIDDLEDGSEDEEESKAEARPYMTLIKSLTEDSGAPSAKRRKLDHQEAPSEVSKDNPGETDQETAGDVDFVEEAEEARDEVDAEDAFDEEEDDEDDKVDTSDPFNRHFVAIDEASISRRLTAVENAKWTTKKATSKGTKTVLNGPDTGDDSDQISIPSLVSSASDLPLKQKLRESMSKKSAKFSSTEQSLAPYIFGYKDLLYCKRTLANGQSIRRLACLHALNHVFKSVQSRFSRYVSVLIALQDSRSSDQEQCQTRSSQRRGSGASRPRVHQTKGVDDLTYPRSLF